MEPYRAPTKADVQRIDAKGGRVVGKVAAPFPWYGGKSRVADLIWSRLGNPTVYIEPFAGSLACLLARSGGAGEREIVSDTDGGICNFWRAVTADPAAVASYAEYPTIHHDLTARHRWLRQWVFDNSERLSEDPEFYDAKAAGWWVWGISLWIGGGWCQLESDRAPIIFSHLGGRGVSTHRIDLKRTADPRKVERARRNYKDLWSTRRPECKNTGGGRGVSAQRISLKAPWDVRPHVAQKPGGQGVSAQRVELQDQMPAVGNHLGGKGISAQRKALLDNLPCISAKLGGKGVSAQRLVRPALLKWFRNIQERLESVIVINRSWERVLTPSLLMQTETSPDVSVGIVMDPPYRTERRDSRIYVSDLAGTSDSIAHASFEWSVNNGHKYRIAYCCHAGDFVIPAGWTVADLKSFKGVRNPKRRQANTETIMFSPACLAARQGMLSFSMEDDAALPVAAL